MNKKNQYVIFLIGIAVILTILGILMSMSISSAITEGFSLELFYRQIIYSVIGIVVFILFSSINHTKLKKFAKILFLLNLALVVIALFGKFDSTRRIITIGNLPFSLQPSQYVFITLTMLFARVSSEPVDEKLKYRFFTLLFIIVLIISAFVIFEPDMGTGIHILLTGFALLFILGIPIKLFLVFSGLSVLGGMSILTLNSEWQNRIQAFLNPYKYASSDAMQALQALRALARGGITGVGFMRSLLKFPGGLPVSSSDFVFAIIGEEFGILACFFIILFYAAFVYIGFRISRESKSAFSRTLAFGLTFGIVLWSLINIAVNIMLIPTTGVPLSFVSFGGNNLIANFISLGILVNIAKKEVSD